MATSSAANADIFDYVIVGSGAAGSVLAARLSEDPGVSVCVIESGPSDRHPYIHVPAGFIKIMFNPAYTWQFKSEPTPLTNGRAVPLALGRTIGGSSSINGMVVNRGQAADFDSWAQAGNRGWSYADVLPYFRRFERCIDPHDSAYRGQDGRIPVTDTDWANPLSQAFLEGADHLGIPRNSDYNGASQVGSGYYQRAIYKRLRRSAARQYLLPAARRNNQLEIRTNTRAARILFDGTRAIGVETINEKDRSDRRQVHARREVIISGGTVNSARLLQISGVGPAPLLSDLGVPVVHALPGVGENFRDHYSIRVVARAKGARTINEMARGIGLAGQIMRWLAGKPSILTLAPSHAHLFWKSEEALDNSDLQIMFTPASYKQGFVSLLDDFPGMSCGFWQQRPQSRGQVRATTTDPFIDPVIQPNYLSDPIDQRAMINGVRLVRRLYQTPQMQRYFVNEVLPGPDVQSDEQILRFLGQYGGTGWHVIGTAKMGPASDPTAVVDDQLRVHGLQNLRVIDASIMPTMPSANTYASTLMIAEKASDMLRGRSA